MDRVCKGGGSLTLASLIDKAGEALFQDLLEVYGFNLIHAIEDDVSPVEIILMIRGLGLGSRFIAVLRGSDEFVGWDAFAYQMATLIDAVNYVTYAVIAANSGKRKPKEPKPSYRPSKEGRKTNNAFAVQLAKAKKAKGG